MFYDDGWSYLRNYYTSEIMFWKDKDPEYAQQCQDWLDGKLDSYPMFTVSAES